MSDSSVTTKGSLNIDKILSNLKKQLSEIDNKDIKININGNDAVKNIKRIQKELNSLVNNPYDIKINIDAENKAAKSISDVIKNLNNVANNIGKNISTGISEGLKSLTSKGGLNVQNVFNYSASKMISQTKSLSLYKEEAKELLNIVSQFRDMSNSGINSLLKGARARGNQNDTYTDKLYAILGIDSRQGQFDESKFAGRIAGAESTSTIKKIIGELQRYKDLAEEVNRLAGNPLAFEKVDTSKLEEIQNKLNSGTEEAKKLDQIFSDASKGITQGAQAISDVDKKISDTQQDTSKIGDSLKETTESIKTEVGNISQIFDDLKGKIESAFNFEQPIANITTFKEKLSELGASLTDVLEKSQKVNILNAGADSTSGPIGINQGTNEAEKPALEKLKVVDNEQVEITKKFNDELGKTRTIITDLKSGKKTEIFTQDYAAQTKAQEQAIKEYNKVIKTHEKALADAESKAFKQGSQLKGQFAEPVYAQLKQYQEAFNAIKKAGNTLADGAEARLNKLRDDTNRIIAEQKAAQKTARDNRPKDVTTEKVVAENELDKQVASYEKMGVLTDALKAKYDELKQSIKDVNTGPELDEWRDKLDTVKTEAQALKAQMDLVKQAAKFEIDTRSVQTDLENIKKKYQEIIDLDSSKSNTGIEEHFEKIQQAINNMNPQTVSLVRAELTVLRREVNGLMPQVQSFSQVLSQSFGGLGQYLARFVSATYLISKAVSTIKSMANEVRSLDSSLVELQKVTNLTGDSLQQFTNNAYDMGRSLGRTGKDVIDATTTFSRAGYDLQEATELAKSALVMSNVGVDIPNIESAASDMISILKAYDKQAEESMGIIDELYNVSNKEPLDFGNLTQMLVTAGGTLAQTGTTIEQSMGLLTGAFATLRDTSVSNGLTLAHCRSNVA